jgi:hypothetical protein
MMIIKDTLLKAIAAFILAGLVTLMAIIVLPVLAFLKVQTSLGQTVAKLKLTGW